MATLRRPDTREEVFIPGRCLVGRSSACDLVLADKSVSGHHAAIEWLDTSWQIQDLGSRNGTFVDGAQIAPQARAILAQGAMLRFGRQGPAWEVTDASEPRAMARDLGSGGWRVAEGGYLTLGDADAPECCIFQRPSGAWVAEREGDESPVEDRATIATEGGGLWRIFLPVALAGTIQESLTIARLRLRFRVSRDEEQVDLTGYHGDQRLPLEIRAHHYPLLLLARRRLADRERRAPEPEQGWMALDELLQMLRMSESHFNIAIHRARSQLGQAGVIDAALLVERQTRMKRLRIGVAQLEIAALE